MLSAVMALLSGKDASVSGSDCDCDDARGHQRSHHGRPLACGERTARVLKRPRPASSPS